jgi:hypothetical protein
MMVICVELDSAIKARSGGLEWVDGKQLLLVQPLLWSRLLTDVRGARTETINIVEDCRYEGESHGCTCLLDFCIALTMVMYVRNWDLFSYLIIIDWGFGSNWWCIVSQYELLIEDYFWLHKAYWMGWLVSSFSFSVPFITCNYFHNRQNCFHVTTAH